MKLEERVLAIAGDGGWWKESSAQVFRRVARRLVEQGFSEDQAVEILHDVYCAVAHEYGD